MATLLRNSYVFWLTSIGLAIIMVILFSTCEILFKAKPSDIPGILFGYGLIATLIEKFCELFIIKSEVETFRNLAKSFRTNTLSKFGSISTRDKVESKELEVSSYIRKWGFILGLFFSGMGLNLFKEIADIKSCPSNIETISSFIFQGLGMLLTATLIAAGGQFVWSLTANANK